MSKAICIIPARGGSKRIPKKNIKDFFGKPLIAYSIEVALASGVFDKVVVSTDDENIAKVAKEYGAEVPYMRPKELSDDFSGTAEVIEHMVEFLRQKGEEYDYLCTLYATAPLLQKEYLVEGFEKLKNSNAINAFSATTMPFPIQRTFKIDDDGRCEMFTPQHYYTRSQDLEEAYQDAGQFYWSRLDKKSDEIMFGNDSIPVILPRHLVQDIDTLEDWTRAELLYETLHRDRFDEWNNVKKKLEKKERISFKQGEIYFLSVGQNIGQEIYGHSDFFLRPVLIYKKLSKFSFLGIPLTSTQKNGTYYHTFTYTKKKVSTALLNQIRVFDIRRSAYFSGNIKIKDFKILESKLKSFIEITPHSKKKGIGHASKEVAKKSHIEIDDIVAKEVKNVKN